MESGILVMDKPEGLTSYGVIRRAKRFLGVKKIGHCGTLDPMATGVLILVLGTATRWAERVMDLEKTYSARIRFGVSTSTQDREGAVLEEKDSSGVTREAFDAVLPNFTGDIQQIPPMHSAVHHGGRRLYELARKGIVVPRAPRSVRVHELTVTSWQPPEADVRVRCSRGTYVRTLADDMGRALGVGGTLWSLRRDRVGPFCTEDSLTLEDLEKNPTKVEEHRQRMTPLLAPASV